ncbi:carbohydrate-binding module family 13 protein [Rhizophagus irregularis DAOM 181602=DAOM 197198]|nr:carbohydrate-binding module family 13 protein [Rhizophagus irregularis DAOM 181602=DAOM 197198]
MENDGTLTHIKLPNISPEIFQIILRYIYGGKLSLEEYDTLDIIKILVSSNELNLQELTTWGIAQNLDLPSDFTDYSQNDFNNLKNTLQRFIPFIKFYNLTSKEFLEKVFPYEKIFPEDLYRDLLRVYLSLSDPNSKPSNNTKLGITKESKRTVDSKIITYQHVELISKWIDRLEITDKLISSYEFRLLYRASRGGYSHKRFHEICDNQPRTVTLVKVKDSNEILGGYNPLEWKSDEGFSTTKDSFIFSFSNEEIENYILSRVIIEKSAIYNSPNTGLSFGESDLKWKIWLGLWLGNCKKSTYENPIRKIEGKFAAEEFEVFQIVLD